MIYLGIVCHVCVNTIVEVISMSKLKTRKDQRKAGDKTMPARREAPQDRQDAKGQDD